MRQDVKNIMSQNLEKMTVNCNLLIEKLDETHKYETGRKNIMSQNLEKMIVNFNLFIYIFMLLIKTYMN